jgi:Zn finger protein HypA/HybF involved in hydrogenase expression
MEAIVRNIEDKGNVKKIVLEIGELVGIEAGHLKGHMVESYGWDVEVVVKDAVVECECGFDGRPEVLERLHDLVIFECPQCGGIPEVIDGKDIKILKIIYK